MPESCIIAVAITGSLPRKEDNPAVPISASEQIESTHQAFEAGASLVHIHVRNDDQTSSSDPERFAVVQEGVRLHCPGIIVQFSTGGRGRDPSARGSSLTNLRRRSRLTEFYRRSRSSTSPIFMQPAGWPISN
jgi:3-keto-5-aminohexanoate cleavage enzyme